jgi:hypothetical protein
MLRIIGIFILIYLFFRIFTSIILPAIIKWQLNRFKKKYYGQNSQQTDESKKYRKGDVNITIKEDKKTFDSDNIGDYVDYEDIKDDEKK